MSTQLIFGDSLERMQEIEAGTIDLVLADMPYGTTSCKWDSAIPLDELWLHLKRVIKPNGVIVLTAQTPFDKVLGVSSLPMLKYEWIWEKTTATGHLNANKAPMKAHENVFVFYKKQPTYNFQKTFGHPRKTAIRGKCSSELHGKENLEVVSYDSTERYPRNVLVFKSDKQKSKLHPTQKPLALMEYLVATYTNEAMKRAPNGFVRHRDNENTLSATLMKHFRKRKLFPTDAHRIYSFRHSFEKRMLEAGLDYGLRCLLMGHSVSRPEYGDGGKLSFRHDQLKRMILPFSIQLLNSVSYPERKMDKNGTS